jgi:hypothetical protein
MSVAVPYQRTIALIRRAPARSREEPAVRTVPGRPESPFVLVRAAGPYVVAPGLEAADAVTRVQRIEPGVVIDRAAERPGELVPLAVEVVERAVRPRSEHDLRHRVGEDAKTRLALAKRRVASQRRLGEFSLGDVGVDAEHAKRVACPVADHGPLAQHPANRPVGPNRSKLDLVRLSVLDGLRDRGLDDRRSSTTTVSKRLGG